MKKKQFRLVLAGSALMLSGLAAFTFFYLRWWVRNPEAPASPDAGSQPDWAAATAAREYPGESSRSEPIPRGFTLDRQGPETGPEASHGQDGPH